MNQSLPHSIQRHWNDLLLRQGSLPQKWLITPWRHSGFSSNRVWKMTCCDSAFIHSLSTDSGVSSLAGGGLHLPGLDEFVTSELEIPSLALRQWDLDSNQVHTIQSRLAFQEYVRQFLSDNAGLQKSLIAINQLQLNFDGSELGDAIQQNSIIPSVVQWSVGRSVIECDHSLWTLETWLPGAILSTKPAIDLRSDGDTTKSFLEQLVSLAAKMHVAGYQWTELLQANQKRNELIETPLGNRNKHLKEKIAPGLRNRIVMSEKWLGANHNAMWTSWDNWLGQLETQERLNLIKPDIAGFSPDSNAFEILERISKVFRFYLLNKNATFRQQIDQLANANHPCYWVNRDLWRENILIQDNRISGIVDFGAAREDSPVLELVRMISSFLPPKHPLVSPLLEQYKTEYESKMKEIGVTLFKPIDMSPIEYDFLDDLATILSLCQWLEWFMNDQIDFDQDLQRSLDRMNCLLSRLEP